MKAYDLVKEWIKISGLLGVGIETGGLIRGRDRG